MNITGIVLAGGTSLRMGPTNKLLLKYKKHTIIEEVLEQLSKSDVDDILIVTGFEHDRIEELLAGRLTDRIRFVYNSNYCGGHAESIKCGIRHITDRADAALFMVADKPGITSALINRTINQYGKHRPAILYVNTPSGRGHPIIFSRALFNDLLSLEGDVTGNDLIEKYRDDLLELKDEMPQINVNNEADYHILLEAVTKECGE